MAEDPNRWEGVYQSKAEAETSWYEERPQVSIDLIERAICQISIKPTQLFSICIDRALMCAFAEPTRRSLFP